MAGSTGRLLRMSNTSDAIVVGAGISGLSCARELAANGSKVVVLERDRPGSHASGAAAGILAARAVANSGVPGRMFYTRSLGLYDDWVARLERESGIDAGLLRGDDWCFFPPGGRADRFRQRLEAESDPGLWEETDRMPPELGGAVSRDAWRIFRFRGEGWCLPERLMAALGAACEGAGVRLEREIAIAGWHDRDGVWRVETSRGDFEAPVLIVAAGPWSGQFLAPRGWRANLVPVRGQLALVPRLHGARAMVHLEDTYYAVPRGDQTLVGATVEHGVWEETVTENGVADLQRRLGTLFPALDLSKATRRWSGIRPRTRDRVPHLGWLEPGRLMVASGHYRSGISMAPRTGEIVVSLMRGNPLPEDAIDLDPLRARGGYRRCA